MDLRRISSILLAGVLLTGFVVRAEAQSRLPACPEDQNLRYHNCFGTYTTANGATYVGEFKDDKLDGQETLTFANDAKIYFNLPYAII